MQAKKLKDHKGTGEKKYEITDHFLGLAGFKAIRKISVKTYRKKKVDLAFSQIAEN